MLACEIGSPNPIPSDVPIGCPYWRTSSPAGMGFVAKRFPAPTLPETGMERPSFISISVPASIGVFTTATLSESFTTIAQLLIDATCKKPSIDDENLSRHKARRVGSQEYRCSREFFDTPESLHRSSHQELLAARRPVQEFFIHGRAEYAGCNRVHAYAVLCPFDCQRL